MSKRKLQMQNRESKVIPAGRGSMSAWVATELAQLRDDYDQAFADLEQFYLTAMRLEKGIAKLDALVCVLRGDDLREHVNEETAGSLNDYLTQLALINNRLQGDISWLYPRVLDRIKAIDTLLRRDETGDDGETLQSIAADDVGNDAFVWLKEWRDSIKLAGRQKGAIEKPLDWLCNKLVDIYLETGEGQPAAFNALWEYLDSHLKPALSIEAAAWKKLQKYQYSPESLWRNVRNKPHLMARLQAR